VHLRHTQPSQPAGPLAIDVTEIRPDDLHRDERTHPEDVVHHRPLPEGIDREAAFGRAALIAAGFAPGALDRYRVKVVTR
jgi:hypothetical protein